MSLGSSTDIFSYPVRVLYEEWTECPRHPQPLLLLRNFSHQYTYLSHFTAQFHLTVAVVVEVVGGEWRVEDRGYDGR